MASTPESFLGKIKNALFAVATGAEKALEVTADVLPFLSPFLPMRVVNTIKTTEGSLDGIMVVVADTEATAAALGQAHNGAGKLTASQPKIQQLVKDWLAQGLPGGAHVHDQAGFEKGCADLTSAMVEILNATGPAAN